MSIFWRRRSCYGMNLRMDLRAVATANPPTTHTVTITTTLLPTITIIIVGPILVALEPTHPQSKTKPSICTVRTRHSSRCSRQKWRRTLWPKLANNIHNKAVISTFRTPLSTITNRRSNCSKSTKMGVAYPRWAPRIIRVRWWCSSTRPLRQLRQMRPSLPVQAAHSSSTKSNSMAFRVPREAMARQIWWVVWVVWQMDKMGWWRPKIGEPKRRELRIVEGSWGRQVEADLVALQDLSPKPQVWPWMEEEAKWPRNRATRQV